MEDFKEICQVPNDYAEVSSACDGSFIMIQTDPYEGQAFMSTDLAVVVHEALGRAIAYAKTARASN